MLFVGVCSCQVGSGFVDKEHKYTKNRFISGAPADALAVQLVGIGHVCSERTN